MKNLKLKSARAALDMSQQQLADIVGVSRQTINAIEKGDYNPTINLCIAICKAVNKTLDELFWDQVLLFNLRVAFNNQQHKLYAAMDMFRTNISEKIVDIVCFYI